MSPLFPSGRRPFQDFVHIDAQMVFCVNAFPIADHQYLGGFVVDAEGLGHFVGDRAVFQQVQVIKIKGLR